MEAATGVGATADEWRRGLGGGRRDFGHNRRETGLEECELNRNGCGTVNGRAHCRPAATTGLCCDRFGDGSNRSCRNRSSGAGLRWRLGTRVVSPPLWSAVSDSVNSEDRGAAGIHSDYWLLLISWLAHKNLKFHRTRIRHDQVVNKQAATSLLIRAPSAAHRPSHIIGAAVHLLQVRRWNRRRVDTIHTTAIPPAELQENIQRRLSSLKKFKHATKLEKKQLESLHNLSHGGRT